MRGLLICAAIIALSGCSTASKFQDMTPQERAITACSRVFEIHSLNNQIRSLERSAGTMSGNLGRGYAVFRDCETVEVPDTYQTNCMRDGYGNVICDTATRTKRVRRCSNTPVSINPELERHKLDSANDMLEELKAQKNELFRQCYRSVVNMSPEEAYFVFKTREMP